MSYLKSSGTVIIYVGLFLAMITFIPGLPPETEFREYSIVPPRDLDPKLGPRNLTGIERLFENGISGPEDFASYDGQLYSGVHGGYVVRIEKDRYVPIVKFGEHCDGIWQQRKCGRPLGMRFDKNGNLYVVDAYYGIFKVDIATRKFKNIVNISKPIEGKIPKLPNSLDIADNGDLYWTDSSTDAQLSELVPAMLLNPSGRLVHYNAAKQQNRVLMNNLAFANGVVLSDDESYVLVAETERSRIMKYNLKGPKAGKQEVFIDGLPGMPDNLVSDGHGGILVTTVVTIDSEHPNLVQSLIPHPYLRKMFVRLLLATRLPFKLLQDIYPNTYTEKVMHAIVSYEGIGKLFSPEYVSLVLRIDASGKIIDAVSSVTDGISSVHVHKGYLWLGSPWLHFISRVPLKQAFPNLASQTRSEKQSAAASDTKSERAKRDATSTTTKPVESKSKEVPTQTTPKPTAAPTTTPKPTAAPPTTTTAPPPTTTPKSTAAPKPSPKVDKPVSGENAKPSEAKSTSANADAKKTNAKKADDVKPNAQKSQAAEKVEHGKTTRPREDL